MPLAYAFLMVLLELPLNTLYLALALVEHTSLRVRRSKIAYSLLPFEPSHSACSTFAAWFFHYFRQAFAPSSQLLLSICLIPLVAFKTPVSHLLLLLNSFYGAHQRRPFTKRPLACRIVVVRWR